jgi:hypothetical protein
VWQTVQDIFAAGSSASTPKRGRNHSYMLTGMVVRNACGRELVASAARGRLQYRCPRRTNIQQSII